MWNQTIEKKYIIQCKKCNKIFELILTQYTYNIGKYRKHCSRSCANGIKWTEQDKLKKSIAAKNSQKVKQHLKNLSISNRKNEVVVKICPICSNRFQTNKYANKIYCSIECYKLDKICQFRKVNKHPVCSGYHPGAGFGKSGWYRGIWCDSSWQLAFVIYHLDHNLNIVRNKQRRIWS